MIKKKTTGTKEKKKKNKSYRVWGQRRIKLDKKKL